MKPRPTSFTVIAIFHFIFGGLGLLCGAIGLAGQAAGGGAGGNPFGPPPGGGNAQQQEIQDFQKKVEQRSAEEAPLSKPVSMVTGVVDLLLSVLMIVAGVGLLQVKPFGWWGSMTYGVVSLLRQIFGLIFALAYALPISQRILDEELKSHPAMSAAAGFMQMIGPIAIGAAIIGMIYPAIVLIVMSRPAARAAVSGKLTEPEAYDERFGAAGRPPDAGQVGPGYGQEPPPGYGQPPPGYGGEPDDRIGPAR